MLFMFSGRETPEILSKKGNIGAAEVARSRRVIVGRASAQRSWETKARAWVGGLLVSGEPDTSSSLTGGNRVKVGETQLNF